MTHLSAIRLLGILVGAGLIAFVVWRRRSLRRTDRVVVFLAGVALVVIGSTDVITSVLEVFDFRKGGGQRILGLAVFGVIVLFALYLRLVVLTTRLAEELTGVLEGVARDQFRRAEDWQRFRDRVAVVIPAYDEEVNLPGVLPDVPGQVAGVETSVLVVDDGSRDETEAVARSYGANVARLSVNRGTGAALRLGYRLMVDAGARVVVTVDADGQHVPAEMERLVQPVLRNEVDVAIGSRVLGHAEPGERVREVGVFVFGLLISALVRRRVTDCSSGFRAVRPDVLPQLVLRQEQFHASEFIVEAVKRRVRLREFPVTVRRRAHGRSKKPAAFRYGLGFARSLLRAWLRSSPPSA